MAGFLGLRVIFVNLSPPAGMDPVGKMRRSGFLAMETTGMFQGMAFLLAFS